MTLQVGCTMHREYDPRDVVALARHAEDVGLDAVWLVEDCFHTTAPSLAAAVLAATERIQVGIGILPAVARNVAFTAMEAATLARLGPGRVTIGIGHGVPDWMRQIGAAPRSPVGTLETVVSVLRRLMRGEEVTIDEHGVSLDAVRLDAVPEVAPDVLVGARGPRSLAAAGRVADGIVVPEHATPDVVAAALDHAGRSAGFRVAVYARWDEGHTTPATAADYLDDLATAGVDSVGFFPSPDTTQAREDLTALADW